MISAFSARRRADEFDAIVSGARPDPSDRSGSQERYADLLAVVEQLREVPDVSARPEFVGSLRERLMAEADTALVPAAPSRLEMPVRPRRRDRRVAALVGGVAVLGSAASMAVAAQGALPGESLYPLKRGIESVEVRFTDGDVERGRTVLAHARDRLAEAERLAVEDDAAALVPGTIDDFSTQAAEGADLLIEAYDAGGDAAAVESVRAFNAEAVDVLADLQPQLPEEAQDELLAAGQQLLEIDARAAAACPTCEGGIDELPAALLTAAAEGATEPTGATGTTGPAGTSSLVPGAATPSSRPAPLSTQDDEGLEVPELNLPTGTVPPPVTTPTPPTPTAGQEGQKAGEKAREKVREKVRETVEGTTEGVDETLGEITGGIDESTGGLLSGLGGTVDESTGGLLGSTTGGLLGSTTGELLP